MLDTTMKSEGIVAHHPPTGSERESGSRPDVAGTVAGTRYADPANRRSDSDLFVSELRWRIEPSSPTRPAQRPD
jgi:hypothetical protein